MLGKDNFVKQSRETGANEEAEHPAYGCLPQLLRLFEFHQIDLPFFRCWSGQAPDRTQEDGKAPGKRRNAGKRQEAHQPKVVNQDKTRQIDMQQQFPHNKKCGTQPPRTAPIKKPLRRIEQRRSKSDAKRHGNNQVKQVVFTQRHRSNKGNRRENAGKIKIQLARQAGSDQYQQHGASEVHGRHTVTHHRHDLHPPSLRFQHPMHIVRIMCAKSGRPCDWVKHIERKSKDEGDD